MTSDNATSPLFLSPVFFLMGPTATGKTSLAIRLAQQLPIEIISVDSAMVYRGMDIGTAKPDLSSRQQVPHHLLDVCEPKHAFSAGEYYQLALAKISEIQDRGHIPLCVGGSMLYFNLLKNGLAALPPADEKLRAKLIEKANQYGTMSLYHELQQCDAPSAMHIKSNDLKRIIRALEVWHLSGKRLSDLQKESRSPIAAQIKSIALLPRERRQLDDVMAQRLTTMLANGFIDEVRHFYQGGDLDLNTPSMQAVGYRQVWSYLQGDLTKQQMIDAILKKTQRLAKHQMTWLRRWPIDLKLYCDEEDCVTPSVDFISKEIAAS